MNYIKQALGLALRNLPRRGQPQCGEDTMPGSRLEHQRVIIAEIYYERLPVLPDYDRICR
jgi:hypothetical protein